MVSSGTGPLAIGASGSMVGTGPIAMGSGANSDTMSSTGDSFGGLMHSMSSSALKALSADDIRARLAALEPEV